MRAQAHSNLKRLLWLVGGAVVALVVATWLTPFLQTYEIKTAAKLLCNDLIRAAKEKAAGGPTGSDVAFGEEEARTRFLGRVRAAGIRFDAGDIDPDCKAYIDKDQPHCISYRYTFDKDNQQHVCRVHVRYRSDTQPALVGDVLQELPHLKLQHHLDVEPRINAAY